MLKVGICQPFLTDKWQSESVVRHKEILDKANEVSRSDQSRSDRVAGSLYPLSDKP